MSQFDFGNIDPFVVDGVQLADFLNQWRDAIYTVHRGAVVPPYAVPGMVWVNDGGGPANWSSGVYLGPSIGTREIYAYDTTTGLIALSPAMLATTKPAADDSQAVATTAHVKAAIAEAVASAIGALLPTGTYLDLIAIPNPVPAGWVLGMQGTIGPAGSAATIRANADCEALYKFIWNGISDAWAPVTGGRGPDANADWIAGKPIGGLDMRGVVRATWDALGGTGAGRLPTFFLGQIGGAATHTLSAPEMPSHNHGPGSLSTAGHGHTGRGQGLVGNNLVNGTSRAVGTGDGTNSGHFQEVAVQIDAIGALAVNGGATAAQGGSGAHNNTQPTRTVATIIKL